MTESLLTDTVGPETAPELWASAPTLAAGSLTSGTRVADRYLVREVLGSGGFAVVYLAFDEHLKRDVALKVLRADRLGPAALQRFRREAAAARDVVHENLVRVFDLQRDGDLTFLTMEAVTGETLRARLARGPLPVDDAVGLAMQILAGLAALHGAGLLHRDVKPGNILLTTDGTAKVADLGLVRHLAGDETRATRTEAMVGTLEYVSPEQALGEELDPRSDLYSFGTVLFEMLAGRLPHEGKSSLGTLLAQLRQPLPDLRTLRPGLPEWLVAIVERLLAQERTSRYASAEAVRRDLAARRTTGRSARRARSLRRLAAAAVVVAAAVAAAVAWRAARPRFAAIASEPGVGVHAVDGAGHVLWTKPAVRLADNFVPLHLVAGGPLRLAAQLGDPGVASSAAMNRLNFLDPETGASVDQIELPRMQFPGFADRFSSSISVTDVDDDGSDEVIVDFLHDPYWPSYTVLYEPRLRRARLLLAASGHHRFAAAVDLDGDARRELLFVGMNNRMGWYQAVAAVRVPPAPPAGSEQGQAAQAALSPDNGGFEPAAGLLAWYTLLPRRRPLTRPYLTAVDSRDHELQFGATGDPALHLDFAGFVIGSSAATVSNGERQALRAEAYERAREAARLLDSGATTAALAPAQAARERAHLAGDAILAEWGGRLALRALAAAGQGAEAEALFDALRAQTADLGDLAFDAGRAFHLAGDLDRAMGCYRSGLGQGSPADRALGLYDLEHGLLLALLEQGRLSDAEAEAVRWERALPGEGNAARTFRQALRWRQGLRPEIAGLDPGPHIPALFGVWLLELRLARGEAPGAVLADIANASDRLDAENPLLLSVKSEACRRLGQRERAAQLARTALERARSQAATDVEVRAHLDLLAQRAAALTR